MTTGNAFAALAAICVAGGAIAAGSGSRGELLYNTYCVGCHTTQVHWRERRQVRDWTTLTTEVARWQKTAGQNLDAADIDALAAYLNDRYYHFPGGGTQGSGDAGAPSLAAGGGR